MLRAHKVKVSTCKVENKMPQNEEVKGNSAAEGGGHETTWGHAQRKI